MLVPVFFLYSCSEPSGVSPDNTEARPLEELRTEVHEAARKKWQDFQEKHKPVEEQLKDNGASADCNCYYIIDEVNYKQSSQSPDVEIDFFSNAECIPGDPFACRYFSALYFSGPVCGSFINPECGYYWPSAPPPGLIPFECVVPKFSTFDINGFAAWVNENCFGDYTTWTITFRIVCEDTKPDSPGCGAQSYVSEPITISGNPVNNHGQAFVSLINCGCDPVPLQ